MIESAESLLGDSAIESKSSNRVVTSKKLRMLSLFVSQKRYRIIYSNLAMQTAC